MFWKQTFSALLTDPTAEQLHDCVQEACSAANTRCRLYLVDPPANLEEVLTKASGVLQVLGGAPRKGSGTDPAGKESSLGVAWYTRENRVVLVVSRRGFARANAFGKEPMIDKLSPNELVTRYLAETTPAEEAAGPSQI